MELSGQSRWMLWVVAAGLLGCASPGERRAFDAFGRMDSDRRSARPRASVQGKANAPAEAGSTAVPTQATPQGATPRPQRSRSGITPSEPRTGIGPDATLGDYLRYGALNNPGLEAAFSRWKAALERSPQVTSLPDPRLTYGYFIDEVETRVGPQRHRVGVEQTFPWFGKLRLRGDAALAEARAVYEQFVAQKLKLFFEIKHAYYELYYLARALAITRENMGLVKRFEQVARSQYRVGSAQHADVIRAQVELGKLEDELRSLEDMRQPLAAQLNAALNRPAHAAVPWPKAVPSDHVEAKDEQVLAWVSESSPELRALAAQIEEQQAAVNLAKRNYYPDVTLGLEYIDTGSARTPTSDSGKDPVVAKMSINVPLWQRRYRAAEREARARLRGARHEMADRANTLAAELKLALFKQRDAERKIGLYRDALVPKAEQSLKAIETAYAAGKMDFLSLIDAEQVLLAFRLAHERALADRAQRLAEIEMLVGRELPRKPKGVGNKP